MRLVNRTFDELQPGDTAELRRLITQDDLYGFASVSGNFNPMHLPNEDGDGDGHPDGIAPGMFVASLLSAVLGSRLPGPGTLYRRQALEFHQQVREGDELITRVTVLSKAANGEVTLATEIRRAGDAALVLSGEAVVIAPIFKFDRDDIEVPGLIVQRHRHFDAFLATARPLPALVTAVVCPEETNSLGGALLAMKDSIITPILVGHAAAIRAAAAQLGAELSGI